MLHIVVPITVAGVGTGTTEFMLLTSPANFFARR